MADVYIVISDTVVDHHIFMADVYIVISDTVGDAGAAPGRYRSASARLLYHPVPGRTAHCR